jgi:hypothetical protein
MLIAIRKFLEKLEKDHDPLPPIDVLLTTGGSVTLTHWRVEEGGSHFLLVEHTEKGVTAIVPDRIVMVRALNEDHEEK